MQRAPLCIFIRGLLHCKTSCATSPFSISYGFTGQLPWAYSISMRHPWSCILSGERARRTCTSAML